MSGRLTPPSVQGGAFGFEPGEVSNFKADDPDEQRILSVVDAQRIGREIYDASTNWLNAGRRSRWNESLRAFQSIHPGDSKYLSNDYRFRSKMFRPKTRAMVRRDEAATASAFFSNEDVVSITPGDEDDPQQHASAEVLKALLQYRLTKTIPWFMTLVGARQDAEVMGICIGKADWAYEERFLRTEERPKLGPDGMPVWDAKAKRVVMEDVDLYEKIRDEPVIDLIAPENVRFEPGCDWRNPVKSSPYFIELAPVYIHEAMERMEEQHGAPAEWVRVAVSALRGATDLDDDQTRRSRELGREPGKDGGWKPRDYDICWTRLNIMRWGGQDWCYRTLAGGGEVLEAPRPIKEVYLHGERPYVVGSVVLETHKTYPSSKIELTKDLQQAANQDWNSRFDSIMLSLQPRQFVREGLGIDINDMRTFMPGKVVSMPVGNGGSIDDAVKWDRPPPVDGASFQEQDRINLDWDDLTGAFTNSSVQASQIGQQSATGMNLMSGEASGLNEYELRLFAETWVEPMLRLMIKLEQAYETDPVILALAGKQAQLFQRFGVSEINDELLNQDVTVKCNVGIGATNPKMKLQNFAMGAQILGHIFGPSAAQGANFEEVSKEIFALLGYKDGARFFHPQFDPRVAQLQQQLQKAQQKGGAGAQPDPLKLQGVQIQTQGKLQEQKMKSATDEKVAQIQAQSDAASEQAENWRAYLDYQRELQTMQNPGIGAPAGGAPPHPVPAGSLQTNGDEVDVLGQMARAMSQIADTNNVILSKLSQKKRIVRGADGRVAGIETGEPNTSGIFAAPPAPAPVPVAPVEDSPKDEVLGQMVHVMEHIAQTNNAILDKLNKKKRVVRGADGRVAGIETVEG